MKYGNHKWVALSRFGKWKCFRCNLVVEKPYEKPPIWKVDPSKKFFDYRDARIPKTCEEIMMHEALE